MGWLIFKNSIWFIYNNFGSALRISLLPYTILFFSTLMFGALGLSGPKYVQLLVVLLLSLVFSAWIAVGWHRFILLGEYPNSWIPVFQWSNIMAYAWRIIFLVVGILFSAVPLVLLVSLYTASPSVLISILLPFFVFLLGLLIYRFGLILPAIAIGNPLSFRESWQLTRGITGAILIVIILSSILNRVTTAIRDEMSAHPLFYVWNFASGWVETMLTISILTMLYGVLVEKRELS